MKLPVTEALAALLVAVALAAAVEALVWIFVILVLTVAVLLLFDKEDRTDMGDEYYGRYF